MSPRKSNASLGGGAANEINLTLDPTADAGPSVVNWSFGPSRYTSHPAQHSATTFREFARQVLAHRARDKKSAPYITAGFGGDGRRCSANVLPRRWLCFDVDGIDPDVLIDWRLHLSRWRGFGWPTFSSTPESPRERVIIELSAPVSRSEGIAIGALLLRDVAEVFGSAVRLDPCAFRGEHPAFVSGVDVRPFYLMGDPLDVPVWLSQAPEPEPGPASAAGLAEVVADARVRFVVEKLGEAGMLRSPLPNGRGYAVECPWSGLHKGPDNPTSTAILYPSTENGHWGAFRCLHQHCEGRALRDVVSLLDQVLGDGHE